MKAQIQKARTLPFFDSQSVVVDLGLLEAQVLDATGSEVAVLSFSQVIEAPNLFLSDPYTPLTLGQHNVFYKYNDSVVLHGTLDVGQNPISDFAIGDEVDVVLEDNIVGGPNEIITAHLYNGSGVSLADKTYASFTGGQSVTTFSVDDGDFLTFQVLPDTNATGPQTLTFLCAPAVATGTMATYAAGALGDTADYSIDGGTVRSIDLDGVANNQAAYLAALNAQLKGAYARDAAGEIEIVTDSLGSSSTITLSNMQGNFSAITGLSEATDVSPPAANNVLSSESVTFVELKVLVETTITDGAAGDRITLDQESSTNNLVFNATAGAVGDSSQLDLQAGTASLLAKLGITGFGSQGGNIIPLGSDGTSVQAFYSAAYGGYVLQDLTFNTAQEVFIVWFNNNVQAYVTDYLITPAVGKETILITVGKLSAPNTGPHIGTTVTVSSEAGVQITQGVTDVTGFLRLEVPPGKYVFSLTKAGVVYTTNNFEMTVEVSSTLEADSLLSPVKFKGIPGQDSLPDPSVGTDTQAFQLITEEFSPTVTASAAPADMCTLFAQLYHMDGTPVRNATVHVGLVHRPELFSGTGVFDSQRTYKTDSNGYVEFSLVQGIQVEVSIAPLSLRRRITVPSSEGPTNLLTILSGADDPFDILTPNIVAAPKRTL